MGWLNSQPLEEIFHRLAVARVTLGELAHLAPDEQRDVVVANLDRLIADHEAELDRRDALAAEVIARMGVIDHRIFRRLPNRPTVAGEHGPPTERLLHDVADEAGDAFTERAAATPEKSGVTAQSWRKLPVVKVPGGFESGTTNPHWLARFLEYGTEAHLIGPKTAKALGAARGRGRPRLR